MSTISHEMSMDWSRVEWRGGVGRGGVGWSGVGLGLVAVSNNLIHFPGNAATTC